ncbi:MAG: hypothetical protein MAG551_01519 [Candidatus Scalindua arabica]|uniref:Tetratricopeptide repeat protein n=1 Tax=Candidatus Scalindua arabica TaxID=1127984 RepID=A0A941W5N1_9BACT|nr:hypothetical protein [Candidatus Scalindua arabica]
MITILILLLVLNSSADAETLDDLVRSGYAAYSVDQIEEAREILEELEMEYPDSHNGKLLQILVEIKEGNNTKAERLLIELDSNCNINSSSCDSPSVHIIAQLIKCELMNSESDFRLADKMIKEQFNNLYKDCYESMIDIYIKNNDPASASRACDAYISLSEGDLGQDIAMKCFVVYYSCFRNEDARKMWRQLSVDNKELLKKQYDEVETEYGKGGYVCLRQED